jgi:hypothetical protein
MLTAREKSIADIMSDGSPDIECEETPYLMRHAAIRKTDNQKNKYVRVFEWVAPFYCYIATGAGESATVQGLAPDRRRELFHVLHSL